MTGKKPVQIGKLIPSNRPTPPVGPLDIGAIRDKVNDICKDKANNADLKDTIDKLNEVITVLNDVVVGLDIAKVIRVTKE